MNARRIKPAQDVTDSRVVRALAHPLRVAALALLDERVLSPKELAEELGVSLPLASYHVRRLEQLDFIELVQTKQRRGALQHYYRAKARPHITDMAWAQVPSIVKREMIGAALSQAQSAMATAAQEGGFDREDMHSSRTSFRTDERGWTELSTLLAETLERVEQIQAAAADRLANDHDAEDFRTTVLLMLFEGPQSAAPAGSADGHRTRGASKRSLSRSS
jgi:DNA-binding transcriptional ArsR family regulator